MLLSATVPAPVLRLAQRYMRDPHHINLSPATPTVETIRQSFYTVDEDRKFELLLRVLVKERPRQCIIFTQRKRDADRVYTKLKARLGRIVEAMHGDLQQVVRERIMAAFRAGKVVVLVATDVVGRGIDVTGISHIINYDIPQSSDDYVHRVGRTGRAGAKGRSFTLVTPEDAEAIANVEKLTCHVLPIFELEAGAEEPRSSERPKREEPRRESRRDERREPAPEEKAPKPEPRKAEKPRREPAREEADDGAWNGPVPGFLGMSAL